LLLLSAWVIDVSSIVSGILAYLDGVCIYSKYSLNTLNTLAA